MLSVKTLDKRIILIGTVIIILAISFWAGSRVPQLNEKAVMGGEMTMDALGFDTVMEVQATDPIVTQIMYTTLNWANTNKKGMTFGVLFATCLMTLFTLLRKRSVKGSFANSALGMLIGAPLSVCVNCAAPIAQGMSARGARLETTLATMMSSPTMNFIVLTMLFSLFPLYLIGLKIAFTVGFILIVIPLLSRFVLKKEVRLSLDGQLPAATSKSCPAPELVATTLQESASHWWPACKWAAKDLGRNLWYLFKTTVPLMLLAGFLGATLITVLPWDSLAEIVPKGGMLNTVTGMVLVSLVGVFLPVPISFDVIITSVLLAAGMPVKYVAILLCTLGIYSIYAFIIVGQAISKRTALVIFATLTILGVGAGGIGEVLNTRAAKESERKLVQLISESEKTTEPRLRLPQVFPTNEERALLSTLQTHANVPSAFTAESGRDITVESTALQQRSQSSGKPFTRQAGNYFGLNEPYKFSFLRIHLPFEQGHSRTIATGDIHNDGWDDVLFTSEAGLSLYANDRGTFFRQDINVPEILSPLITNAALVDLNNDGWLDIFYSTFMHGTHVIYNHEGRFEEAGYHPVSADNDGIMTTAMGFGDLDHDGDLDVVLGKWDLARNGGTKTSKRSNSLILFNKGDSFHAQQLANTPSAPTSILIKDYNADGWQDVIIGNDFGMPDFFYLGDGSGKFRAITRQNGLIPLSPATTMSIAAGDIDNDLEQELYFGAIARYGKNERIVLTYQEICERIEETEDQQRCFEEADMHELFLLARKTRDISLCLHITDKAYQHECAVFYFLRDKLCDKFPDTWATFSHMCRASNQAAFKPTQKQKMRYIPQNSKGNVLFVRMEDGSFTNKAEKLGIDHAGWVWNMQFADLDNDEWQDLYGVNGTFFANKIRESNYFFHNQKGNFFLNSTEDFGLTSHRATNSSSYIDFDNDGDLDIITIPVSAPVEVFLNNEEENNSISFELRDNTGNRFGIGSKVIIHYGDDNRIHQVRELFASGGKASFNAPIAHFGLGDYKRVSRVEILWSGGERSELIGDFAAGTRYRITKRHKISEGEEGV